MTLGFKVLVKWLMGNKVSVHVIKMDDWDLI